MSNEDLLDQSSRKISKELILRDLYYSPKTGYRSPDHLLLLAKEEDPSISKYFVKQWLLKQSAYTKFKKYNNPKHFRHTMVRDFDQLQMDLVFMLKHKSENEGYQYILTAVEILSRFAFAIPLKGKSGTITKEGIKEVLEQFRDRFNGRNPKLVQFDEGGEFLNKDVKPLFKSLDITYFTTASSRKATVVQRLNRTLKSKMIRMFEREGNHSWIEHLQDLVDNYNDTIHSSIKMKPKDVNEDNKFTVWGRLFGHLITIKKPKYEIGDQVRVLHFDVQHRSSQFTQFFRDKQPKRVKKEGAKRVYTPLAVSEKGKPPFSEEIFEIIEVLLGDPNVYKLYSEEANEKILGIFYEQELSLVKE